MAMEVKHVVSTETIRRIRNQLDRFDLVVAQRGELAANREHAARFPGQESPAPNFRWEIDSTRIDLYVLNDETGDLFRVRPTLYIVLETFCRAPIGLHLDIHPPCTNGFLCAIRNALLPKTYVRRLFPSVQTDWTLAGFPIEVFTDNGKENWSYHTQAALRANQLGIAYLPPYVPHYKPYVERFFRILNQLLFHKLPGTTLGKRLPVRELDPRRDARMTFRELAELLHLTIIDTHFHKYSTSLRMTHMQKWLAGLELHDLQLPVPGLGFDLGFCEDEVLTLRQTGAHIGRFQYQSEPLGVLYGQMGKGKDVHVRKDFDPRRIFVIHPLTRDPLLVPCVSKELAEPLPYAGLLSLSEEELDIPQTTEDEAIIANANEARDKIIKAALLRSAAGVITKEEVKETTRKAPAYQDQMPPELESLRQPEIDPFESKLLRELDNK